MNLKSYIILNKYLILILIITIITSNYFIISWNYVTEVNEFYNIELLEPYQLITILIAVNTFIFGFLINKISEKNKIFNKQLNFLNAIAIKLSLIEEKADGFKKELGGNKPSPYDIDKIDTNFYLKNLDYKIKGISTNKLIEKLSKIDDKIAILNSINKDIREFIKDPRFWKDIPRSASIINEWIEYCYKVHRELKTFISEAKSILKEWKIYS